MNDQFDFSKTYFMVAGIAGGNPYYTTTGSATFATYSVQPFLAYVLDSRQIPGNCAPSSLAVRCRCARSDLVARDDWALVVRDQRAQHVPHRAVRLHQRV